MDEPSAESVLHRMVRPATPSPDTGSGGLSRVLRRAAIRAGDGLGLKLDVTDVRDTTESLSGLLSSLGDGGWLLVALEGPDGRRGAMALDTAAVTALIEVQTLGRLSGAAPAARSLTRTDAMLAEPFIAAFLSQCQTGAAGDLLEGYVFGAPARDLHGLGVLLDDVPHRLLRSRLRFDDSPHEGRMVLAVPTAVQDAGVAAAAPDAWSRELGQNLGEARMVLDVALHRLTLPLDQAQALAVGQMLDIPGTALTQATLRAAGKAVMQGRLGQINGMRAIKLQGAMPSGPAPEFSEDRANASAPASDMLPVK